MRRRAFALTTNRPRTRSVEQTDPLRVEPAIGPKSGPMHRGWDRDRTLPPALPDQWACMLRGFADMNRTLRSIDPAVRPVLLCFSHLRWDFVFQRPQHLMSRAAEAYEVYYIEEAQSAPGDAHFRMRTAEGGVAVLTPVLDGASDVAVEMRKLMAGLVAHLGARRYVHWFYTPMALPLTDGLPFDLCVYDCMDELSNFRFAPPDIQAREAALIARADLVFTGGSSLYAAKRGMHRSVCLYPSSVDVSHFAVSRGGRPDPDDQADLAYPRIGYFGVIDERMDLDLVHQATAQLPSVQFVMLGPVTKIDPASLPRAPNLHWLGRKPYAELPDYLANWQAGWMPFALNEATRFISPTKTPEFLAAGLQVVSTAVPDVVDAYGRTGLVMIADHDNIAETLRDALQPSPAGWRTRVDATLATTSWDATWASMRDDMRAIHALSVEVYDV
jgi:glycosyltransferase involved in cell wall biosynthesis